MSFKALELMNNRKNITNKYVTKQELNQSQLVFVLSFCRIYFTDCKYEWILNRMY